MGVNSYETGLRILWQNVLNDSVSNGQEKKEAVKPWLSYEEHATENRMPTLGRMVWVEPQIPLIADNQSEIEYIQWHAQSHLDHLSWI